MIDPRLRNEFIAAAAADPTTAVILLDVVLGYGSNPDPAGALAPTIEEALATAAAAGRPIAVVASVCGTDRDPQGLGAQEARLAAAGVILAGSNARAARIAIGIATRSLDGAAQPTHPGTTARTTTPARGSAPEAAESVLFADGIRAVNVGLEMFAGPLTGHGATVASLEWRPPADGDRDLGVLLARLEDDPDDPVGRRIAAANATAVERLLAAQPMLLDVRPARDALGLDDHRILHSGPPIEWERMCGPVQGAITGAILFEGWAKTPEEAVALAGSGRIDLSPCHHHGAVGPMAGVVSPSMPVVVVENVTAGTRAYATLNEGLGKVLRFGAYDDSVLERLRWFAATLGPALAAALGAGGPLDLRGLTGQALQMGDEGHNRNIAATSLFTRTIAPALVRTADPKTAGVVLDFLRGNDHFFLNLSMAACKSALDAAHGIAGSTVVTAMARNGVDFGIRMSGTGDRWFTTPVGVPDGLYFPGYGPEDANPDLGDSAITETFGIGGFAMAAAPAIVRFVGGSAADALEFTRLMGRITLARNPSYALPPLGFVGTPTGIDARRVVDSGIAPVINTGIAHKQAGVGQIGAGIARAPLACFAAALIGLAEALDLPTPAAAAAAGLTTQAAVS
jgi:hypothetical protein